MRNSVRTTQDAVAELAASKAAADECWKTESQRKPELAIAAPPEKATMIGSSSSAPALTVLASAKTLFGQSCRH